MEESFLTFKRYNDEQLVAALTGQLAKKGIAYQIEDDSTFFDASFARNEATRQIAVKLKPADFARANQMLEDYYAPYVNDVDKDYYLLDFTTEELKEIILKPDEWGEFDYMLARKLLKEQGKDVSDESLKAIKEHRNEVLAKPSSYDEGLIIIGYILAVLGGFFGIFIGWNLYYSKKTLPDGSSVYSYKEKQRTHGLIIFITSLIVTTGGIIYKAASL